MVAIMETTITAREAARVLRVSEPWLCKLLKAGKGPSYEMHGDRPAYFLADILAEAVERAVAKRMEAKT